MGFSLVLSEMRSEPTFLGTTGAPPQALVYRQIPIDLRRPHDELPCRIRRRQRRLPMANLVDLLDKSLVDCERVSHLVAPWTNLPHTACRFVKCDVRHSRTERLWNAD